MGVILELCTQEANSVNHVTSINKIDIFSGITSEKDQQKVYNDLFYLNFSILFPQVFLPCPKRKINIPFTLGLIF